LFQYHACQSVGRNSAHSLFLDPGALSTAAAEEEQLCSPHPSALVQDNGVDIRGQQREGSFHTHVIGYLSDGEAGSGAVALSFDDVSAETLDTLFSTFHDLIVDSYIVAGFKVGELLAGG